MQGNSIELLSFVSMENYHNGISSTDLVTYNETALNNLAIVVEIYFSSLTIYAAVQNDFFIFLYNVGSYMTSLSNTNKTS